MAPDSIDVVKQYKLMAEEAENIEFMVRDSGLLSGERLWALLLLSPLFCPYNILKIEF